MPPDQDDSTDDAGVLSPDELDITEDESVVEIEEGRYVISAGGSPPSARSVSSPESTVEADRADDREPASSAPDGTTDLDDESVSEWLQDSVGDARSRYGFHVTAKFEDSVSQQELFSNDVSTTFENLVVWYAQQAGTDTPIEEALGILLMESNVTVQYPPETIQALVTAHGLSVDDSIADLLEAVNEGETVSFPP